MTAKPKPEKAPRQTPKPVVVAAWLLLGRPRGVTWTLLAVLGFSALIYGLWRHVQPQVIAVREYQISSRDVEITALPPWIRADVVAETIGPLSREAPLSILDEKLTERVYNAFGAHPWVAKVERVVKRHPARVQVDLEYRRPVCMVEIALRRPAGGLAPGALELLPVDVKGVLLPDRDFSPAERQRYPRLAGIASPPLGGPGVKWGDARVTGGAEVAAALIDVWSEFSLARIEASRTTDSGPNGDEHTYEIFTSGGTQILWGHSPNTFIPGEVAAVDKVARLRQQFRQRNTLEGPSGPQQIDVRDWRQARVSDRPARTAAVPSGQTTRE